MRHSTRIAVGPVQFRIGSDWRAPIDALDRLYAGYPKDMARPADATVRLSALLDPRVLGMAGCAREAFGFLEPHLRERPGRWWGSHLLPACAPCDPGSTAQGGADNDAGAPGMTAS